MADNRDLKRHRKRLTLKFGVDAASRISFTEDISPQGMCIRSAVVSPPGTLLSIDLTLPDGNLVKLAGVVVWAKKVPPNMIHAIKKCGMGVKFTRIEAGSEAFERFCAEIDGRPQSPPSSFVGGYFNGNPPRPGAVELAEIDRLPGAEE
ncbi:MAG TPA: PilZ domain-containing protein [Geobacteraceae bacterium]|nr:PilZ domain-containing protein [Geobacteraceae bacterium]